MTFLSRLTDLPEGDDGLYADFDKRYLNTYLQLNDGGTRRPIYYIGREGACLHLQDFTKADTILWRAATKPDLDIQPLLPAVGYYNVGGTPAYLYKVPQKQWKRSMCAGIYSGPNRNAFGARTELERAWQALAIEVMKPTYAKLDEITRKLFSYVALTPKFAVQEDNKHRMSLLYRQYVVGELLFDKKEVRLLQPALQQEVLDLFKYTGVKEWTLK